MLYTLSYGHSNIATAKACAPNTPPPYPNPNPSTSLTHSLLPIPSGSDLAPATHAAPGQGQLRKIQANLLTRHHQTERPKQRHPPAQHNSRSLRSTTDPCNAKPRATANTTSDPAPQPTSRYRTYQNPNSLAYCTSTQDTTQIQIPHGHTKADPHDELPNKNTHKARPTHRNTLPLTTRTFSHIATQKDPQLH